MGRDGGWPGIELSTGGGGVSAGVDGIIYIVTPVRFESISLLRSATHQMRSHFLRRFFFRIPFIGFHLHLFLRPVPLIFALPLPRPSLHCLPFMFVYDGVPVLCAR